jgi:hypothetical protein
LYGCEILSLTVNEEYKLKVFENRLQERMLGSKRHEIVPQQRKFSQNVTRLIEIMEIIWEGHQARMGKKRNIYKVFVESQEGKRQLGISRCRWEDNVKMDIREILL